MPADLIPDHLMQFWGGTETAYGAGPATIPEAADAFEHLSLDGALMHRRVVQNPEFSGNRGQRPSSRGAYDPVQLTLLMHLRGSGAPGALPESDFLFLAGGFDAVAVPGTSVTYRRALAEVAPAWIWGASSDGTIGVGYAGIGVTELTMPDIGTDNARLQATMQAGRGATVYQTRLSGAVTALVTALPLAAGHGWVIAGAPAWIRVTEGALTEVMRVTDVVGDTATVVRNADGEGADAFTAAAVVTAYVPERDDPVLLVAPIGEVGGGFTLDDGGGSVDREFSKAGITIATGVDQLDKGALLPWRTGLSMMKYGEAGAQLTADVVYTVGNNAAGGGMSYLHGHAESGDPLELVMTVGSEAGNRCRVTLPLAEVSNIAAPMTADGPRMGTVIFDGKSLDGQDIVVAFT